jgi:nucleoid-associated protein EbfC
MNDVTPTNPEDYGNMMEKAQEMQQQMQQIQERIKTLTATGEAGGGLVKVTVNGLHYATKAVVSPTLMGEDEDMLEDLMVAAINDATKKLEAATKDEMMKIAKDMNLPDGFGG